MTTIDPKLIDHMRDMARRGQSVTRMFYEIKTNRAEIHIVDILAYFRTAFCLSLSESKPIAALSRSEDRCITDEELLEKLVMPEIEKHRHQWDI